MKYQNPFAHIDAEFSIRQSKRAKRIGLRLKAPREIILTVPYGADIKEALAFAENYVPWVEKKLHELKKKKPTTLITSAQGFSTHHHQFVFKPQAIEEANIRILQKETILSYPKTWIEEEEQFQIFANVALRETYRREAKQYLPERLMTLAKANNFSFTKVTIRDSKTRWGSCSSKRSINLSLWLMKLPLHLIDYILLHELCHTIEMNHGPRFYKLLNAACGNKSDALNNEVKQFSIKH